MTYFQCKANISMKIAYRMYFIAQSAWTVCWKAVSASTSFVPINPKIKVPIATAWSKYRNTVFQRVLFCITFTACPLSCFSQAASELNSSPQISHSHISSFDIVISSIEYLVFEVFNFFCRPHNNNIPRKGDGVGRHTIIIPNIQTTDYSEVEK